MTAKQLLLTGSQRLHPNLNLLVHPAFCLFIHSCPRYLLSPALCQVLFQALSHKQERQNRETKSLPHWYAHLREMKPEREKPPTGAKRHHDK